MIRRYEDAASKFQLSFIITCTATRNHNRQTIFIHLIGCYMPLLYQELKKFNILQIIFRVSEYMWITIVNWIEYLNSQYQTY